jgi:hypothetical protein
MSTPAIVGILGVLGIVASRYFLLRALRTDAPREFFIELGAPSADQLWSRAFDPAPRKQLQSRFSSFIWKGEFLRLPSPSIKFWGVVAVLSQVALVAAICMLLYQRVNEG